MPDSWNPDQYQRFKDERSRPFFDLMARVRPRDGMSIVDLGCGTGELTLNLHQHLQARQTIGIDNSAAMLDRALPLSGAGLSFLKADIETFTPASAPDLIFSNAALHWVEGQENMLARLAGYLAKNGQLAVQVPANFDHPSHRLAAAVAAEEPFASALKGYSRGQPVLAPERYAEVLFALGFSEQRVSLEVYGHQLESREAVIEWVKGTLLTDYQKRLDASLFERFLARYREVLLPQLADTRPYFYPFKRILFWGVLRS